MAATSALCARSSAGVRRMRESLKESSSWLRLPSKKADRLVLYVAHSASVMAPLTAAYRGSTSMRGVRGALGFFALTLPSRPGSVALDMVGVVDTSMSLGRIVPAIGGGRRAQLEEWVRCREVAGAGRLWVRSAECWPNSRAAGERRRRRRKGPRRRSCTSRRSYRGVGSS